AVNMVESLLAEGKSVSTLGPIIHNKQMVDLLESRGVQTVKECSQLSENRTLVIRSHGVTKEVYDYLNENNMHYADATCPFVLKIHKIVARESSNGRVILIAGDSTHPEVEGIIGHCIGEAFTFKNEEKLCELADKFPFLKNKEVSVVAQTTFDVEEWKKCLKTLKKLYTNAIFFDTICNATSQRQLDAFELAGVSDVMIVIGGRHSSNTNKLFDICKRCCRRTYLIETAAELDSITLRDDDKIGITAGASTPAIIIKEVLDRMSEIKSGEVENLNEQNFEELLEESLKNLNTNDKVHGVVVRIAPNEVYVDLDRKQTGYIPVSELSNDPTVKPEDVVKVGDELELLIMRTNDQEGMIMLSKRRLDAAKGWDVLEKALEEETILTGVVSEVVKGGVIAVSNGVRVFIPASQATASRGESLEALLKTTVEFRLLEINKQRRKAVGSVRSVLKEKNKAAKEAFWSSVEVGKKYTGTVKSLTSYGAFVDIGGVDGMIHISELSWTRIKNPSEVVNVGDTVEVYVKGIDTEKGNISLGYKKDEDNPWTKFTSNYNVDDVVDVTIDGMSSFGAFAVIIPGVKGLIHISQIANRRIDKPQDELTVGQTVKAKITAIDNEQKRVSLSIRALLAENDAEEAAE
ncbi:MAG: bifunctional 4-hydroxy-3-methylbut-2-enyl diphosphate reductase/30S ribosomal protein S1, partial [Lachnospiraceae bacterium]|nr:bifunctional 4-hydroxy-3-methylbut-2-enyl diphosphate reductase/30S ribosomal protein S1 [Lachnospiraceae bacterium]